MVRYLALLLLVLAPAAASAQTCAYALVAEAGWYRAIDTAGRIVADSLRPASELWQAYNHHGEGMFPYVRDHRLGFKDATNTVVIQPGTFYPASAGGENSGHLWNDNDPTETRFQGGSAVVRTPTGKFGMIDRRGRLVADTVYDYISAADPATGAYAARRTDTLCILTPAGKNILPPHYRTDPKLYPFPKFREGMLCAMVRAAGTRYPTEVYTAYATGQHTDRWGTDNLVHGAHTYKVGFLDGTGRLVLDTIYTLNPTMLGNSEHDYRRHPAPCGYGASQRAMAPRNPDPYYLADAYYIFSGGRCMVRKEGGGVYIINAAGDSLYPVPSGAARIQNRNGYFIFERSGLHFFSRDYASEYSILNRQGTDLWVRRKTAGGLTLSSFLKVDEAGGGFFLVNDGDTTRYGGEYRQLVLIDSTGRAVGGVRFNNAYAWPSPYEPGAVEVHYANGGAESLSCARVDSRGRLRPVPWKHVRRDASGREVQPAGGGFTAFRDVVNGLWGYLNSRGEVVIPPRFTSAAPFVRGACGE